MSRPTGGYVKLHRKILQSWVADDPVAAWMLCLLVMWANRERGGWQIHGTLMILERGQVATGRDELGKKLRCSGKKIDGLLKRMQESSILDSKRSNRGTIITVLNYDKYQLSQHDTGAAERAAEGATEEPQKGHIRRREKERREKDSSADAPRREKSLKFSDWDLDTAKAMQAAIVEANPYDAITRKANPEAWANEFRLMREADGLSENAISNVLTWALADKFWSANIRSPAKLRKQFGQLSARMRANGNPPKPKGAAWDIPADRANVTPYTPRAGDIVAE